MGDWAPPPGRRRPCTSPLPDDVHPAPADEVAQPMGATCCRHSDGAGTCITTFDDLHWLLRCRPLFNRTHGGYSMDHVAAATGEPTPVADAVESRIMFRLLGPVEVQVGAGLVPIRGRRHRVVLFMLLLEPRQVITVRRLVEALWDAAPPKTAEAQVQICVSQLRGLFSRNAHHDLIRTHAAGYQIFVADDAVDVAQFGQLVSRGQAAARRGALTAAAADLRMALDLWRGDAADDLGSRLAQAAALRLNEARLAVTQEWLDLELRLGAHQKRIGDLRELVATHPLQEKLHAQLALALYRSGRQAEALATCRHARRVLADEHGIDPGQELRDLELGILENDARLDMPPPEPQLIGPRQLPAGPASLVGRDQELTQLHARLLPDREAAGPGQIPIVAISGPPGVGKTALAVRLAHMVSKRYGDGHLFINLRGGSSAPLRSEQVLNQFLRALGLPPVGLPDDLEELAATYRNQLAGRRVLVVLDDVTSESQVRTLIPGDSNCAVIATSRQYLAGLPGASHSDLDVLEPDASVALLARVIGDQRVRDEPEAVSSLANACGHLPLALHVAAAKLSSKRHWRVDRMAARLRDERRRLDELTLDDVGVRPSLLVSYRALSPRATTLLLMLSTMASASFPGWVAAPLLDARVTDASDVLDDLVEARLVELQVGVGHQARYRLHDLTRIFALEQVSEAIPAERRIAAQHRLLRCWLFLARQAHRRELRGDHMALCSDAEPWPLPADVIDDVMAEPLQWLQSEHHNLVAAVELGAQLELPNLCWDLAVSLVILFETRAYYESWRVTHEIAMEAVRRSGDLRGEAVLHYSRGGLALAQQRLDDAEGDLEKALAWFTATGDRHGRGLTLRDLTSIDRLRGRYEAALVRGDEALADLRAASDRAAEASVLRRLAQVHLDCNRAPQAEELLRKALAICTDVGVKRLEAQLQLRLGEALLAQGDLAGAEAAFQVVLSTANCSNDVVGLANAMLGLGTIHLAREELGVAGSCLEQALDAARRCGSRMTEGQTLVALADQASRSGRSTEAIQSLGEAQTIFGRIGAPGWRDRVEQMRERLPTVDSRTMGAR